MLGHSTRLGKKEMPEKNNRKYCQEMMKMISKKAEAKKKKFVVSHDDAWKSRLELN